MAGLALAFVLFRDQAAGEFRENSHARNVAQAPTHDRDSERRERRLKRREFPCLSLRW
jgi:hypothetical protein